MGTTATFWRTTEEMWVWAIYWSTAWWYWGYVGGCPYSYEYILKYFGRVSRCNLLSNNSGKKKEVCIHKEREGKERNMVTS